MLVAERLEEREALEARFAEAKAKAAARNCEANVALFESAIASSHVVMCCKARKLLPVVTNLIDCYATYHDLQELQLPKSPTLGEPDWEVERPIAETRLLGSKRHIDKLHYGILSLDGRGARNYGNCTLLLNDTMIKHRTSFFNQNTGVYFYRHKHAAPKGYRSNWDERTKLTIAKLADQIDDKTLAGSFQDLLCKIGHTGMEDDYVEAQVFGTITIHTFDKISVETGTGSAIDDASDAHLLAIRDKVTGAGVEFEEI